MQKAIDAVSLRIDRLVGNNASQAIDNFNEILAFLDGLKDSDSLAALLADINARIGSEDGSQSEDGSLWGKLKSLSQDISSCSEDISTLQADRDEMKQELQETAGRLSSTFTNVNNLLNAGSVYSDLSGVFAALKTAGKIDDVRKNGVILSFLTADGWVTKQFKGNPDTDFENVEKWEDFGSGGSGGGNTYNVTGSVPLTEGFYTLLPPLPRYRRSGAAGGVSSPLKHRSANGRRTSYRNRPGCLGPGGELGRVRRQRNGKERNGKRREADADAAGNVNVNVDILEVDETLSADSTNPVENKVVTARFNEVDASTLFNVNAEVSEDETSVRLSFQNKSGAEITAVDIPAGSGGGSGETVATKIVLNAAVDNAIIKEGGNARLTYTYDHQYTTGDEKGESTGQKADITVTIRRGTTTMYSQTVSDVSKGSYELDLSSYLLVGNTDIYVVATTTDPTTGKKQTRQAFTSVKVVSLSLTSSYNLAGAIAAGGYTLADTINIPYAVSGSGTKVVTLYLTAGNRTRTPLQDRNDKRSVSRLSPLRL